MAHFLKIFVSAALLGGLMVLPGRAQVVLDTGWELQEATKVAQSGSDLSQPGFHSSGWQKAVVPGTVLTTLVANGVYPDPLYGENNRPDKIPESLCRTSWWYRDTFTAPAFTPGRHLWLNCDGINYAAELWINGRDIGSMKGAFIRGRFDITPAVSPGQPAALAILVSPQPHPGTSHEHTIGQGLGKNGGESAIDGPCFLCTVGWDWIPAIRDRDTGIWQKVYLSETGPLLVRDPLVTADLPLPSTSSADVGVSATVENISDQPEHATLRGSFGDVTFSQAVDMPPHSDQVVALDSKTTPALHVTDPKLWWPNGYGPQNLYTLHLGLQGADGAVSDQRDIHFGIREITYSVPDSENLTISVNGVRVFCKGGDWGLDEALKRIPRSRLEAQIRMHQIANLNMIRNWVGQSTSDDFYDLCDKYGILLWDEFFQPNPGDGPNPADLDTYLANVKDKILRARNHPSVAVWCARNEGFPPLEIDDALRKLMAQLEPTRLYQPSSTSGRGVHSGGPYSWRPPEEFYDFGEPFKTEIGSVSIPTLESIHGMMPRKDWESIDDDWAEHDLASGASGGNHFPDDLNKRYGRAANLADFVRKGQMMTYEAYRAMYEGRSAKMFKPSTGVITWMSNPAQPSFVWQLYHHDLEPNAALFAVRKACEPLHIQFNEKLGTVEVINNHPAALTGAKAHVTLYNWDGSVASQQDFDVTAAPSAATSLGAVNWPATLSSVHFLKLELHDASGQLLSDNFYWHTALKNPGQLQDLNQLPTVTLDAKLNRHDTGGNCLLDVTLHNPGPQVALMTHLQLHRDKSGDRVLPVYYTDNYVSLAPGESKTVTIEAAAADLHGENPLVLVDGWNVGITPASSTDASIALNEDAQVSHWPVTNITVYYGPPLAQVKVHSGGPAIGDFFADNGYNGGATHSVAGTIDATALNAAPAALYQDERWGDTVYHFPMKPLAPGRAYTVRLHFAETTFNAPGKRTFNVAINNREVLHNFDIYEEAGAKNKAVVRDFPGFTPNADGLIVIHLIKEAADYPTIIGLEIFDAATQ